MYNIQPLPLTAGQIARIQLAGRIIEQERRWRQLLTTAAVSYVEGFIGLAVLSQQVSEYQAFRQTNPRLPV